MHGRKGEKVEGISVYLVGELCGGAVIPQYHGTLLDVSDAWELGVSQSLSGGV